MTEIFISFIEFEENEMSDEQQMVLRTTILCWIILKKEGRSKEVLLISKEDILGYLCIL